MQVHDLTPSYIIFLPASRPDTPEVVLEPDFKIEGRGVDPARLAEELSRRVAERKRSGLYPGAVEAMLADRFDEEEYGRPLSPLQELDYAAIRAQQTWEVTCAYPVATDKKTLSPLILFAKRLARLWARIAVGPIQRDQSAYNRHVARALEALRRQALADRAEARAEEEDLCLLAGSMAGEGESRLLASVCAGALGETERLTVLCPCPGGLMEGLVEEGYTLTPIVSGSSWEEPAGTTGLATGPVSFLSEAADGSLEALLVPELAFWLRPEKLVRLARKSYLALAPGGSIIIAVHGYAGGPPAPAWCGRHAVERALALAGFRDVTVLGPARGPEDATRPEGYVAVARR